MVMKIVCRLAPAICLVPPATARGDTFDFEVGASYDRTSASLSFESTDFPGVVPPPTLVRSRSNTDDDDITVFGTWFFDGVAAPTGPRSRAAFLGRASSVSLSYRHADSDSSFSLTSPDPSFSPTMGRSGRNSEAISANLRYVWPESGWYGLAGVATLDTEFDDDFGSFEFGSETYSLGIGKYIGSRTTLDVRVSRLETDNNFDLTETALTLSHIGGLGETWQYGADVAVTTTDVSRADESFDLRLSLYPSRSLAFGLETSGSVQNAFDERTRYGLFASWFARENIELGASYSYVDNDTPRNNVDWDEDEDGFGLGVKVRF